MLSCIEHHTFTLDPESPMTAASDAVCLDGTTSGRLRPVPAQVSSDDPLVARTRAVWTSGDFDRIARGFTDGAVAFIDRLQLTANDRVLDVGCGTGNLALPAARAGAAVTGVDIAPNLLATARELAAAEKLEIWFDEGNAEELPYPDAAFDTVVSMFGAMFAPRPELVAAELRRVARPGGRIVMANWTRDGFIGAMLRAHVARVPAPAGVPSTLLTRRPDVSAAQSSMLAAQARVGVAQAAWFPSLALTASGGYASPELGDLFQWSARAWGIGALLSLPLFDGGRREAGLRNASAELDASLADYRERVLVAFRDVEDQLAALRLLAEQAGAQERAVAAASRATVLSDSRYRNGFVSQLDLLDAQRSELTNRRQALQVKAAQYQATVGLVRALGGAWDMPTAGLAPGAERSPVAAHGGAGGG